METKPFNLELKQHGDTGTFEGYASVYGVEDLDRDVIAPGAFTKSLGERRPVLLWQHNPAEPLGAYETVEEDGHGLRVRGRLAMGTVKGREVHELLSMGAIGGLSVGFLTVADSYDSTRRVRTIKEAQLFEVSLVSFPANPYARITDVKSTPDKRLIEAALRDAGLSRRDAKAILAGGFKALGLRDAEHEGLHEALSGLLDAMNYGKDH